MVVTILVFLLILSILVLVHEAGHFFVAKFFNIKVEEFGFGFPLTRSIFSIKRGETVYSFYPVLIGGFVKLYGEDEAGGGKLQVESSNLKVSDESRAFYAKPIWQKALVVFAGVFMNFVLAVFLISILFSVVGVSIPGKNVIVDQVVKDAPAQIAGLKAGDTILKINEKNIYTPLELVTFTKKHLGEKLLLKIKTAKGVDETLAIIPRKNYPKNQGPMGVAISQSVVLKKYPWYQAPFVGTKEVLNESAMIAMGLFTLVSQLVTKGLLPADVAGPVGIAQITGTVVSIGFGAVLSFMALLSINLAIINILPIPALDGGRLFFILFEGITRRKINPKIENYAHTIGMAILLGLIGLITLHDLFKLFTGQPIFPQIK